LAKSLKRKGMQVKLMRLLVIMGLSGCMLCTVLTACNNKEEAARARQKRYFGSWDKELEAYKKNQPKPQEPWWNQKQGDKN